MTDLLLDALSTYRLAHLLVDDTILDVPRTAVHKRLTATGHTKLAYVGTCYWCATPYLGLGVIVARRLFPRAWPVMARVLAFSAVAGLLSER